MKLKTVLIMITLLFTSYALSQAHPSVSVNYGKTKTLRGYSGDVLCIAFSPTAKVMAIGTSDKEVVIWDTANWQILNKLKENNRDVRALAFSRDGKLLAAGDRDKKVFLNLEKNCQNKGFQ
jgi:WD40 repeat protein